MSNESRLDDLYGQARDALKARDFDRAVDLLARILSIDEDYRDASQLLARAIRLKRRRWYSHPALWGLTALLACGIPFIYIWQHFLVKDPGQRTTITPDTPALIQEPTPTPMALTWNRISMGLEFDRDLVVALATDPQDPQVLYAGTKNGGIYKSIDGGLSWQPADRGLTSSRIQSLRIDPGNPQVLFAATTVGIFRSNDGGATWVWNNFGLDLLMDAQDNQHLYAHTSESIIESVNGGDSWRTVFSGTVPPGEIHSWAIDPRDGNTLLASTQEYQIEHGFYLSQNGGRSWRMILADESPGAVAIGWDVQGRRVLYTFAMGKLRVSSDDGMQWWSNDQWCANLVVDPQSGSTVQCVGGGISESRDNGRFWAPIDQPFIQNATITSVDHPNGSTRIIVGGLGLAMSLDHGRTWTVLNSGLGAARAELSVDPGMPSVFFLSTYYNPWEGECTLYRSIDGARSWRAFEPSKNPSWCGPAYGADGTLYRMQSGSLLRSADHGATWEEMPVPGGAAFPGTYWLGANPYVPGRLVAVQQIVGTWSFHAFFSDDSGAYWSYADVSPCLDSARYFFPKPPSVFAYASACGRAMRSLDEGRTWVECDSIDSAWTDSALAIDPEKPNRLLAATRSRGILSSNDACLSWQDSNTGLATISVYSVAFDPNVPGVAYAGTQAGAYISFDGGSTWQQINDGLLGATVVYSIVVDADSNVFASTPYGIFTLEQK